MTNTMAEIQSIGIEVLPRQPIQRITLFTLGEWGSLDRDL